jgi:hypothetical protein
MRFRFSKVLLSLAGLGLVSSGFTHHSVHGVFNPEAPFSVTGVVTDVDWHNPHVFLHVAVAEANGETNTWRMETVPAGALQRAGITPEMLIADGQRVTVTGIVAHKDPLMGWVHRITYEDGHFYQLSNANLDRGASQPSVPQQ